MCDKPSATRYLLRNMSGTGKAGSDELRYRCGDGSHAICEHMFNERGLKQRSAALELEMPEGAVFLGGIGFSDLLPGTNLQLRACKAWQVPRVQCLYSCTAGRTAPVPFS